MSSLAPIVFPSRINRACTILFDAPEFRDLPDSYIRVVLAIIKKVNLSNLRAAIVASRATLAGEAGRSIETVQRALRWLESRGFIEREQKAHAGFRGSSSPVRPTQKFIKCLLLDQVTPEKGARQEPAGVQAKSPTNPMKRIGRFLLPANLVWLHDTGGLAPTAILKLMGLAKLKGQKLSNIVKYAMHHISHLRGRELYAYLCALAKKDKDYGYMVETHQQKLAEQSTREHIRTKAAELEGRTFRDRVHGTAAQVISGMLYLHDSQGRSIGAKPLCSAFLEDLYAGRWVPTVSTCLG